MTDPFSILEVDDEQRDSALGLKGQKLSDVAQFCNTFPAIEMNFSVLGKPVVGEATDVVVHLNRDEEDEEEEGDEPTVYGRVCASLYPKAKKEAYWILIGDRATDTLLSIKRVALPKRALSTKLSVEFETPGKKGADCIPDERLLLGGCDQEFEMNVDVGSGDGSPEDN